MDPALQEMLAQGEPGDSLALVLRLAPGQPAPPELQVVARFGDIVTTRLRRDAVRDVYALQDVASMKAPRLYSAGEVEAGPEVDDPADADPSERRPAELDALGASGEGVLLAHVDWGLDFAHPDFRDADGRTRLLALWDQSAAYDPAYPNAYGYGRIFDSAEIDAALQADDPYGALGYDPSKSYPDGRSHGTHTLGISGGNARSGGPSGLAPRARLAFVHLSTHADLSAQGLADSASLLEALDFLAGLARSRSSGPAMPLVVNMSLGRQAGQHDGLTLTEQALDAFVLENPGRAVVQSTGNYHARGIHAQGRVRPGATFELQWDIGAGPAAPHEIDLWYPGADRLALALQGPAGNRSAWIEPGGNGELKDVEGRLLGRLWHRWHDPNNGDNQCGVFIAPEAGVGVWTLLMRGDDVCDGRFHAWIERGRAGPQARARFLPGSEASCCNTGSIANGWRTIGVGAYDGTQAHGPLAPFSSTGPLRSGRHKPDLVAPGVRVRSARSRRTGQFWRDASVQQLQTAMSGTSMAAPHVAGTVALMLGLAPEPLAIDQLRRLLLSSVQPPPEAGGAVARWGHGRLDSVAAVRAVLAHCAAPPPPLVPVPPPPKDSRREPMNWLESETPEAGTADAAERCLQPVLDGSESEGCSCPRCKALSGGEAPARDAAEALTANPPGDPRRPAGYGYRPSPFQIDLPLNGGPPGLGLNLGGPGLPFAFTLPLAGSPPPAPAPVAAPMAAPPAAPTAAVTTTAPAADAPLSLPTTFNFLESLDLVSAEHPVLQRAHRWIGQPAEGQRASDLLRWLVQRDDLPDAPRLFRSLARERQDLPGWRVLARPGDPLADLHPEPGDLVLQVLPGLSFAVVEVVQAPALLAGHRLAQQGWVADEPWPDPRARFVHVLAVGPWTRQRHRARRLSGTAGRLRADVLLLRRDDAPMLAEAASDWAEWAQTDDLDDAFFTGLVAVAQTIGAAPEHLLGVMKAESNIRPDAVNPRGHATGLIQFMPATQQRLGWTQGWEAFARLTAEQQLDFVLRYYRPYASAGLGSTGRLYQATFLPVTLTLGSTPETVIARRDGLHARAYEANAGLDADRKGYITVGDLSRRIDSACHGPRWREALQRLQAATRAGPPQPQPRPWPQPLPGPAPEPAPSGARPVLRRGSRGAAVQELQLRLNRWLELRPGLAGMAPLVTDGIFGPLTESLVRRFQAEAFVGEPGAEDGIVGPRTWTALDLALAAPAPAPNPGPRPGPRPSGGLPGRTLVIDHVPLLAGHRGTAPDLILRWNDLSPAPDTVDVVVHLHGHSEARAGMRIDLQKLPHSGLDMHDPEDPAAPGLAAPTLALLPRGNSNSHDQGRGYDFPALVAAGGLEQLIALGLQRMAAELGLPGLRAGRLVLTAHSGGGAALMGLLSSGRNPDAIHCFDALYNNPSPLITWAGQRLGRDRSGDGLRVLYREGEGTAENSQRVAQALEAMLPPGDARRARWRVEPTRVAHGNIPRRFGWRLLQDGAADLPLAGTTPRPAPGPSGGGSDIVSVQGIQVARRIAPQIQALLDQARADGLRLGGGGWRSSAQQIELRRQHCGPTPDDIYNKPSHLCTPPTARPGHSNHERGLAIDFTNGGRLIRSHDDPAFQWLAANAARYGLSNLPSEPWHWSVDGR